MPTQKATYLKRLYQKYIFPHDPAGILFGKAVKTLIAMILSYVIMEIIHPDFAFQAVFMTLLIALAEAGTTYADRQKNMIISTLLITALSPIAIWAYDYTWSSVSFVFLIVFVFFFASFLGQKFIQMNQIIALCLISPFNSPPVDDRYWYYALTILVAGSVCFITSFYILPLRPRVLLAEFLKLSLDYLLFLSEAVLGDRKVHNINERKSFYKEAHRNIVSFRLIPSNFNISPQKAGGPFAYINRLGGVLERILLNVNELEIIQENYTNYQVHQEVKVFRENIEKVFMKHFKQWLREIRAGRVMKNPGLLEYEIELAEKEFDKILQRTPNLKGSAEWLNTQHFLFELRKIHLEMKRGGDYKQQSFQLDQNKASRRSFKEIWVLFKNEFSRHSAIFRQAIQAATASSVAMLLVQYWDIQYGYWLVIFTLILVKPTMGLSVRSGIIRLTGTALGVLGAFLMVQYMNQSGIWFNILFFLIMGVTVYAAFIPLLVFRVGMYTISVLLFYYKLFPELHEVAYFRFTESAAAVGIAILFSFILWPVSARSQFVEILSNNLELQRRYLNQIVSSMGSGIASEPLLDQMRLDLETRIETGRSHFSDIALEPRRGAFRKTWWHSILSVEIRILDILNHLSNLEKQSDHAEIQQMFKKFPEPYIQEYMEAFEELAKAMQERRAPAKALNLPQIRNPLRSDSVFHAYAPELKKLETGNLLILSGFTWHLNQLGIELNKVHEFLRKIY